jgi:hypothetical protein
MGWYDEQVLIAITYQKCAKPFTCPDCDFLVVKGYRYARVVYKIDGKMVAFKSHTEDGSCHTVWGRSPDRDE